MRWLLQLWKQWQQWQTPLSLGAKGERAAERFLQGLGYKIVARGYKIGRGEIDLVAVDGRTVVFVEVKTRNEGEPHAPAEAVDQRKQEKLTRLALGYLKRHGLLDHSVRFDVVAIVWPVGQAKPQSIRHFPHAFTATGHTSMFS